MWLCYHKFVIMQLFNLELCKFMCVPTSLNRVHTNKSSAARGPRCFCFTSDFLLCDLTTHFPLLWLFFHDMNILLWEWDGNLGFIERCLTKFCKGVVITLFVAWFCNEDSDIEVDPRFTQLLHRHVRYRVFQDSFHFLNS